MLRDPQSPALDRAALETLFERAARTMAAGQPEAADKDYTALLSALPGNFAVLCNAGIVRLHLGRLVDAAALLHQATLINPESDIAWYNLALALQGQGHADALPAFANAVRLAPRNLDALLGYGTALNGAGRIDEAIQCYQQAVTQDPHFAPAWVNLGRILAQRGTMDAALACCDKVVALRPNSADAFFNLGTVLRRMGRTDQASAALERAYAIDPTQARVLINLGNVRKDQNRFEDAAQLFEHGLSLEPGNTAALTNLAHIRQEQGQSTQAIALNARILSAHPDDAHASFAQCMAHLPIVYRQESDIAAARAEYDTALRDLCRKVWSASHPGAYLAGVGANQPFYLPYQNQDDRALQTAYGNMLCHILADRFGPGPMPPPIAPNEPIRVGFVSGFFRDHSNWKIPIRGWLEHLNRDRFRLFGYHTSARQDAETSVAAKLCDRFVQGPLPLEAWRAEVARDAPHVLIYPEIGIDPVAVQLAAQRLAPVQCNSWGQPVTSGMPTLDYFLSSALMEPDNADRFYSETLIRLPNLSIHYTPPQRAATPANRAQFGFRDDATIYWCGQSLYKFLPQYDWVFPEIAAQAGNCQFAFIRFRHGDYLNQIIIDRLSAAFNARGLRYEDHVVMLPYMDGDRFAASLAASDVFLDSIGWSGCNTMLESLPYNLPIVTLPGPFMRGRHGAAIATAIGLDETIAHTEKSYCAIAARLARDPDWLAQMRQQVAVGKHRALQDKTPVLALESFLSQVVQTLPR